MKQFLMSAVTITLCGNLSCGRAKQHKESNLELSRVMAPVMGMTLGRGFDPTQPINPLGDCLENVAEATAVTWKDARGIQGQFSETQLQSLQGLFKELSFLGNFAAESLWGSGNAYFSKYEKFKSDANSFTWMVDYLIDVGDKTILGNQIRLSAPAQQLVDAGQMLAFYNMCGTEYVRSVKLGGRFVAVFEIDSKHSEWIERLTSTFGSKLKHGSWGFSGSAKFSSYLNDAYFKSALKREIMQLGGQRIDFDNIDPTKLGDYLLALQADMHRGAAVPIQVETASWETLGIQGLNDFAKWHRKERVSQLYNRYRHNLNLISKIEDFMFWQKQGSYHLDPEQSKYLNTKKRELEAQQAEITSLANACIEGNKCDAPSLETIDVELPERRPALVLQSIGSTVFSLPRPYALRGASSNVGELKTLTYIFPRSLHHLPELDQFQLFVYERECSTHKELADQYRSDLRLQGQDVRIKSPSSSSSRTDFSALEWHRDHNFTEIMLVFAKDQRSKRCAVAKLHATGGHNSLEDFQRDAGVKALTATLHYRSR